MSGLTAETTFEIPEDEPLIGEKLLRDAERFLCGLKRVTIQHAGAGGWRKVNTFVTDEFKPGEDPANSADDVAKMIMLCVAHHYEKTGRGGGFRAQFTRYNKRNERDKSFSTFPFPIEEQADTHRGSGYIDEPTQYIEYLKQILETQKLMNSQLIDYNINLTTKLLETASAASGKTEPLIAVISTLVGVYESGLRMSSEALTTTLEMKYNTRAAELEAENDSKMWDTLAPAVKIASKQIADHYGIELDDDDEDDDDDDERTDEDDDDEDDDDEDDDDEDDDEADDGDDDDADGGDEGDAEKPEADDADPKADTKGDGDDEAEDEAPKKSKAKVRKKKRGKKSRGKKPPKRKGRPPVVRTTKGWLEGLTQEQWFAIEEQLSESQWKLLKRISKAKNDDQAAGALGKLSKSLLSDLERGMKLRKLLRGDQWEALQALIVLAERHRKEFSKEAKAGKKAKTKSKQRKSEDTDQADASEPEASPAGDDDGSSSS